MSYYIRKNGVTKKLAVIPEGYPAELIGYVNTGTNLQSDNAQDAITELDSGKVSKSGDTMTGALIVNNSSDTQASFSKSHTSTTSSSSDVFIGNNKADGTAGSSYGVLLLYGTGNTYTALSAKNSTVHRNISLPNKSGTLALTSDIPTITKITQNVSVTANDLVSTDLNFGNIDTNKILMVQVTWSNTISDNPTAMIYYAHNKPYINKVNHKWSATQTVTFYLLVLHT